MDCCGCWRTARQRFDVGRTFLSVILGLPTGRNACPTLKSYQTSGSAQRQPCELRQAGNGATVATAACVAGKSGVWPIRKDEGGRMKDEVVKRTTSLISQITFKA